MTIRNSYAIILAAGEGKRMKSKKAKVVHKVCGKEMVKWVRDAALNAGVKECCVVIGHEADQVKECLQDSVEYALQNEQLGTGHAVKCAADFLKNREGHVIILCGDVPLITSESILKAMEYHINEKNDATIITAHYDDPNGYGRIVRDSNSEFYSIVEDRDCDSEQKLITECNSGIYCFKNDLLLDSLEELECNNSQGEYYLTDVPLILKNKGYKVGTFKLDDYKETLGVNDRIQLAQAGQVLRSRIINKLMLSGVTFIDPDTCYIDAAVIIGNDTIIYPNCIIEGNTKIASDCIIGPNSRIVESIISENTEINNSVIIQSRVGKNTKVGPFAYMRPNNTVGDNVKVGDFVELKNSTIGDETKISHLTYVGDSVIGKNVNLGCGVVTVNYNGKYKHKTIVGDNAFIGCNVNLIAPVEVETDAYIAAGSTITNNVPTKSLAIARQKQVNIEG